MPSFGTFETKENYLDEKHNYCLEPKEKNSNKERDAENNLTRDTEPEDFLIPWRTFTALCVAFAFTYSAFEGIKALQAFVSCAVGVQWVGYSMAILGFVASLTALIANYLAQYTGRIAQFTAGMTVDIATVVLMLLWEPDSRTSPSVLMVVPMMSGFSQGILQPQQQALIGSAFSREQLPSAYAAANFVKSLSYTICLCLVTTSCFSSTFFLTLGLYVLAVLGYTYIEIIQRREDRDRLLMDDDEPKSGRPKTSTDEENTTLVDELIKCDRRMKMRKTFCHRISVSMLPNTAAPLTASEMQFVAKHGLLRRGVVLQHDNATLYSANLAQQRLQRYG
ncbi:protein unc-93 homolog A [Elysia marginata]|uniref:Protein unc-93 homolog A n=1 Tax=Elysia marginata TaxID=1093978 RepID=A0AAV4J8V0_9GAST|nr:protein unc-93 homolog A [Elysia marginata]